MKPAERQFLAERGFKPSSMRHVPSIGVVGATGNQGSAIIRALVAMDPGLRNMKVKALTSDPTSTKATALIPQGVPADRFELVKCNLNEPEYIQFALSGCVGAIIVSDFWQSSGSDAESELDQIKCA